MPPLKTTSSRARWPAALPLVALLVQAALLGGGWWFGRTLPGASPWPWVIVLVLSSLNLAVISLAFLRWLKRAVPDAAPPVTEAEARRGVDSPETRERVDEGGLRRRLQGLEADLMERQRRLERLEAGRDRARQESQLKSDYLALLGRELQLTMEWLDELIEAPGEEGRGGLSTLRELRERLGDLDSLLTGLVGERSPAEPARRSARVLIVDDGPVNLMLARQVLERQGLEVEVATSGDEALSRLERMPFDVVLMDIFMPGMDGMETSRRWRSEETRYHPGRRSVLVALTANASDEDRKRFREAGMDDYLAKPYRPQELIDRVRYWLPDRFEEH